MVRNYPFIKWLVFISFTLIWLDSFVLRTGLFTMAGSASLLLCIISVFFINLPKASILTLQMGVSLVVFFVLFDYSSRSVIFLVLVLLMMLQSKKALDGVILSLILFSFCAIVVIFLAFLGIGGELQSSNSRLFGRYSLGFSSPQFLFEAIALICLIFLNRDTRLFRKIYSYISIFFIALITASRVGLLMAILTPLVGIIKGKVMQYAILYTLLAGNLVIVYFLHNVYEFGALSSFRDLVVQGLVFRYEMDYEFFGISSLLTGVTNDALLADEVTVKRWEKSIPLDGIGVHLLSSGIIAGIMTLYMLIYLIRKSVSQWKTFVVMVGVLCLGLGTNILNVWHVLPIYLFCCIAEERNKNSR